MSLKAIASETLARLRSGETVHETKKETELKQVKQPQPCFTEGVVCSMPMKQDYRHKTAENGPCFTVSLPRGETHETTLPIEIADGLAKLADMATPRLLSPDCWPVVVADARRLASDGWATQALALGWSPLDLFGAVTDPAGDPEADGLAVRLSGRRVLALCASFATVANDGGGRAYLYRGNNQGARLLWALGRGR